MQINDIFHNCPEQQQQEQQQSNPKDLGSKFPRSKRWSCGRNQEDKSAKNIVLHLGRDLIRFVTPD